MWRVFIVSIAVIFAVAVGSAGYWIYDRVAEKEQVTVERFEKFKERKPKNDLPHIGYEAPKISLVNEQNENVELGNEKPVLVVFWAEWSSHCHKELEKLAELYPGYEDKIQLMLIDDTTNDDEQKAKKLIAERAMDKHALYDRKGSVVEEYGIKVYPTSFLIGTDGKIKERVVGSLDKEKWKEMLDKYAAAKK